MRPVPQVFTAAALPERPAPFQALDRLADMVARAS
jgi:hypothetical protein